jgi:hypothetical protein
MITENGSLKQPVKMAELRKRSKMPIAGIGVSSNSPAPVIEEKPEPVLKFKDKEEKEEEMLEKEREDGAPRKGIANGRTRTPVGSLGNGNSPAATPINPSSPTTQPPPPPPNTKSEEGAAEGPESGGANNNNNSPSVVPTRRIFSLAFKKSVLDAFAHDLDCAGNQRATARKFGVHRRQVQKWLLQLTGSSHSMCPTFAIFFKPMPMPMVNSHFIFIVI